MHISQPSKLRNLITVDFNFNDSEVHKSMAVYIQRVKKVAAETDVMR